MPNWPRLMPAGGTKAACSIGHRVLFDRNLGYSIEAGPHITANTAGYFLGRAISKSYRVNPDHAHDGLSPDSFDDEQIALFIPVNIARLHIAYV